jgi:cell division protein FtsI/penicillin-binding protein 2
VAELLGDGTNINMKARSTMYDYLHGKFRLGQVTGVQLADEVSGIVPKPDVGGASLQYATMSFGQGMDLTMVQVAAGFSAIVNGGTYHSPTVVEGTIDSDGALVPATDRPSYPGVIKSSTSAQMRKMIVTARNAFYGANDRQGYEIGGKTGTSQTIVNGSYDNGQTIATYLGFGGDTKPRYVIMVQVSGKNKSLAGNKDAMPIFTDISNWMIDYLKLQPKA